MPWARNFCPFRAYWIISSVQVNIVLVVFFTCPRVVTEKQREVLIIKPLNERKIMDEKKRQVWRFVIQTAISILTAIATALGVTSCMAAV